MIYNTISSKVCIARVFDRFNIDYSGFISRVPNWVYQCMAELDIIYALQDAKEELTVTEYNTRIPYECKELIAVEYESRRLPRIYADNIIQVEPLSGHIHPFANYEVSNNHIITSFEDGTITIYYKKLPVEFDSNLRLYFPTVPDNEDVLVALDWYLLKRILERGHNVPGYSLRDANPFTNPGLAFKEQKPIARNSMLHISLDEREELSKQLRTFIKDYEYLYNYRFNQYKIEEDEIT